jgi:hypothetical protein
LRDALHNGAKPRLLAVGQHQLFASTPRGTGTTHRDASKKPTGTLRGVRAKQCFDGCFDIPCHSLAFTFPFQIFNE